MRLLDNRLKQKVQIGGIHVTVRQHGAFSQGGERADDTGLSGASLTT
jgi:hypothetical protein